MTEEDIDDNDNESSTGTDVKFRIKVSSVKCNI